LKKKILVIDGEPDVREMARVGLKGFRVRTVPTGEEGIQVWRKWKPDLVILDYMVPGMGGLDVLKEIHSKDRFQPVLVTAGRESVTLVSVCMREGAVDFLVKPIDADRLRSRVDWVFRVLLPEQFAALQEKLRQLQGEEFAGWISLVKHQILNPLQALNLALEVISDRYETEFPNPNELKTIREASREIQRVVQQL
jgi:DNA-binding response OmpR family regulator